MFSKVNNNVVIGKNFRNIRGKCGLTIRQIADYLNVEPGHIFLCEIGYQSFSTDIIERASNLFGCRTSYITENDAEYVPIFIFSKDTSIEELNAVAHINRIYLNLQLLDRILIS